jgi:phosphatidylserine decarboxylase
MRLTRYGSREIALGIAAFAVLASASILLCRHYGSAWLLSPLAVLVPLLGWLLWFFRDPERTIPDAPSRIVSPADGVVTHLDEWYEPEFIGGRAKRLSIFLSIFDVHLNRAPAAGVVGFLKFRPGAFFDARREEALAKNQNQDLGLLVDDPGLPGKMLIRQSTGAIARNIVCPIGINQRLARGERYGMIKFGSRTTLFVSGEVGIEWLVKVGDKVRAGETAVARTIGATGGNTP